MSIPLQELFEDKCRQFGVLSSSNRFTLDFIKAVNAVQRALSQRLDKATYYADVDALEDSSAVEDKYENCLDIGITAFLWIYGHQQGGDFSTSWQMYQSELDLCYMEMQRDISNRAEDDELDAVGLGYIDTSTDSENMT